MRTSLAIGIGAVVAVLVIVFCILPLKEVSYQATEKYLATQTYYVTEPYTSSWLSAASQREITLYQDVAKQTNVWKERPVTLYKKVSFLEAAIAY